MKAFKYLVFFALFLFSFSVYSASSYYIYDDGPFSSQESACSSYVNKYYPAYDNYVSQDSCYVKYKNNNGVLTSFPIRSVVVPDPEPEPEKCPSATKALLKVPSNSGDYVCTGGCQYKMTACVDVKFDAGDFEPGMTCGFITTGQECGTPKPTNQNPNPVTQDPINPTDKPDEQKIFENIMSAIGEKLDGIKDAITGGNQNQNGGDTGGSNGGDTGGDVNVNVDMSETNAKIDETNSLIDELTKWLQGEDLGDDIFGDQEPPEKELTPQQFDTNIFSGRAQCPADARLSFNLLGGKTFTKTFEFKDWCDNLEIFGALILAASYLYAAYIVSKA